jgi:hypothetical protein
MSDANVEKKIIYAAIYAAINEGEFTETRRLGAAASSIVTEGTLGSSPSLGLILEPQRSPFS